MPSSQMNNVGPAFPAGDDQFEDSVIDSVERETKGWSITKADGWSFWVPGDSPVTPAVGMTVRMYGRGIGSPVRGLFLDGTCVFYRTEEEDRKHFADEMYGKDAADIVSRWDAGRSIWSVAMGGFGPGYEQALQIAMIEFLRHLVGGGTAEELDTDKLAPLGLSGAQWGAARSLAGRIFADGPQATLKAFGDDRKIQVGRDFPTLDADILAVLAAREVAP